MTRKSVFLCSMDRGYTQFTILSYAVTVLLVFSSNTAVWAKAPETAKIVFMSKRDGNPEIYIMNPDGSEQVNLTQHRAADYVPVWSPNGKYILFSSDRDESSICILWTPMAQTSGKYSKTANIERILPGRPMANVSPMHKEIQKRQSYKQDYDLSLMWILRFALQH